MIRKRFGTCIAAALAILASGAGRAAAATPAATYLFADSFDAVEPLARALQPVDPLGTSGFEDALVLGQPRRVYRFDGNAWPPEEQAGLTLPTADLLAADRYSVEMVFEFVETNGVWRRILDVQDRRSDNGFYVSPQALEQIYEDGVLADGVTPFTTGEFHHVVLTNEAGVVRAFLDGRLELTATSPSHVMDIVNERSVLNLFLDNVVGGGIGEFADGRIALLRVYDAVLGADEVAALAANPFTTDVDIDVKPGSFPNAVNLGSQGVVPVAILGSATFDPTTSIDPFTVTLASAPVRLVGRGTPSVSIDDVNGDGFADLVVQVSTQALQISDQDTEAVLEARTKDNLLVRGVDSVRVVP